MNYSLLTGEGIINPPDDLNLENSLTLEDVYELAIEINVPNKKFIVREVGGRILRTKYKWKLIYADVHMYPDGSLCLCPQPEEELMFNEGFSLKSFFNNLLIPNLYYHTYLNIFGKEPWKSSSHGVMGVLESYSKQKYPEVSLNIVVDSYVESLPENLVDLITSRKRVDQNLLCICGSGRKFRECHSHGFLGLTKLCDDYRSSKGKIR